MRGSSTLRLLLQIALPAILVGCGSAGSERSKDSVFWGVAYGPFRANQTPGVGPQPTADQMRADMQRLAAIGGRIRTYSVAGDQAQIPAIAGAIGLKTWVGAWLGRDQVQNAQEVQ